ncbi:MAG: PcfJ domain-containing protein [Pirellulaceae bacterium]
MEQPLETGMEPVETEFVTDVVILERTGDGFLMKGQGRCRDLRVQLLDTCWQIVATSTEGEEMVQQFGLVCTYDLVDTISLWRLGGWDMLSLKQDEYRRICRTKLLSKGLLCKRVAEEKQRIFHRLNHSILAIHKVAFASCTDVHRIFFDPRFYDAKYQQLRDDVLRYRAAAVAVHSLNFIYQENSQQDAPIKKDDVTFHGLDATLEAMSSWRRLFSDTGKSYRALNRTLDRLPGKIAPLHLTALPWIHLNRAYENRTELLCLLLTSRMSSLGSVPLNFHVFRDARKEEIVKAIQLVGRALNLNLGISRTAHLSMFCNYLVDYPHLHRGRIVGLAEAAIRYHRSLTHAKLATLTEDDGPVSHPPIPVPDVKGLRFLASKSEIIREGQQMEHCIGNYVPLALVGSSFLFHYEHGNEMASIEVNCCGKVRQSFGPGNSTNIASKKAKQILSRWGRQFPPCDPSVSHIECFPPF